MALLRNSTPCCWATRSRATMARSPRPTATSAPASRTSALTRRYRSFPQIPASKEPGAVQLTVGVRSGMGAPSSHAASAPRGALLYPRLSREELEGRFLGLMAYLDGKPEGD